MTELISLHDPNLRDVNQVRKHRPATHQPKIEVHLKTDSRAWDGSVPIVHARKPPVAAPMEYDEYHRTRKSLHNPNLREVD